MKRLLFILNMVVMTALFTSSVCLASISDELVKRLEMDNWEKIIYNPEELNKFKNSSYFSALVDVVENKGLDWHIRIRGIRIMSKTGNIAAPDVLINMLYDPFFNHECPAIKSSVAEALGNFKSDQRVVDALLHTLNDEEIHVREASVDSLGKIGDKRAVPPLLKLLQDRSIALRIAAVRALGLIGDASVSSPLQLAAEKDSSEEVRHSASETVKRFSQSK